MNPRLCVLSILSFFLFPSSYTFGEINTTVEEDGTSQRLFTLQGSNTIGAKLAPELAKAFLIDQGFDEVHIRRTSVENEYRIEGLNKSKKVHVDVHAHGSSTGFKGLLSGAADVAMSSRPIKQKELEALADYGDMQSFSAEHIIAIDGLAIIVHPSNRIGELNVENIAKIFSGKVNNWSQLGGMDLPINIYARDDKSGTWDTFKSLVLQKKYTLSTQAQRFESNDKLSDEVASDIGGIGFVGLASVNKSKVLAVSHENTTALAPQEIFVATEDYSLSRRLFMYSSPNMANDRVKAFLAYAQGNRGQKIVQNVGFVSQNPIAVRPQIDTGAPASYANLARGADRLSINFRFREGSASLDNKAKQDILRLVRYMAASENQGKYIQLVGFGDSKQTHQRSLVLSKLRAIAVKSALLAHDIPTQSVLGFGSFLPVAANTAESRSKNQRVEVWLFGDKSRAISYKKDLAQQSKQSLVFN